MKTGWFDELVLKHEPHLGVWRGVRAQVRHRQVRSGFSLFVFIWL
jgi:hypothetical protein